MVFLLLICLVASIYCQTKPNILFFLVDDMGWQDTSVPFHTDTTSQNRLYQTPNMERLAQSGIRFTNAYAHQVCSPTRISIMTGMNAVRHHVTNWTLHKDRDQSNTSELLKSPLDWNMNGLTLEDTAYTLPALLRQNGYYTIHVGKAHFGVVGEFNEDPTNLGFDENIAGHAPGAPGSYQGTDNYASNSVWDVPGLEGYHGTEIHLTEALTMEAKQALDRALVTEKPFYLYMAHYTVHTPIQPHEPYYTKYLDQGLGSGKAKYASMVEGMDVSLGELLDYLDTLGVAEQTLVVFASDNGGLASVTDNAPLRAGKGNIYEGGTRIPLIFSWARASAANAFSIPQHAVSDKVVSCEDFLPTLVRWGGGSIPAERQSLIDGEDITGYITRDPAFQRKNHSFFFHFPHRHTGMHASAMRKRDMKIIYFYEDSTWELYNLEQDIGESTNLASNQPIHLYQLATELQAGLENLDVQYPTLKATNEPATITLPEDPGPYVLLSFTSPVVPQEWVRGETYTLTWESPGDTDLFPIIELAYQVANQQDSVHTLGAVNNIGSYLWTVPADIPDSIRLHLISSTSTAVSDVVHISDPISIPHQDNSYKGIGKCTFAVKDQGTIISPSGTFHEVVIYNPQGTEVRRLPVFGARVVWDKRDALGQPAEPGLYIVEFAGQGIKQFRRSLILGW